MPDSGFRPHKKGTLFHPSCEFQGKNGRVLYCLECRRLALEYAGYYLLFHRSGYDNFLACIRDIQKDFSETPDDQEVMIGPKEGGESIRLKPEQIREMSLLMEMAVLVIDTEVQN